MLKSYYSTERPTQRRLYIAIQPFVLSHSSTCVSSLGMLLVTLRLLNEQLLICNFRTLEVLLPRAEDRLPRDPGACAVGSSRAPPQGATTTPITPRLPRRPGCTRDSSIDEDRQERGTTLTGIARKAIINARAHHS